MSSGRLFLVVGPESTGTRLTTRVLIAGGCHGSDAHKQPLDTYDHDDPESSPPDSSNLVWRRSIPHDNEYPSLANLAVRVPSHFPHVVVTIRDWYPTASSRIAKRNYAITDRREIAPTLRSAYRHIFRDLAVTDLPYTFAVYESLILHPGPTQRALWQELVLPGGNPVEVTDQDAKHFEEVTA